MSKKTLDIKTARKFIIDGRNTGKTDQEIYDELSQEFYDKKTIALLIRGTVTNEKKNKYKIYNNVLLGLIGIFVLSKALGIFRLVEATADVWIFLLLTTVIFLLAGYFMYAIAKYDGHIYRICGLLISLSLVQQVMAAENGFEIFVCVFLSTAIACLAFYLNKKMFPNYNYRKLKKDNTGEYIFNC